MAVEINNGELREFNKEDLRELVLDSYELMLKIPNPSPPNFEIKSRSKLKNLSEALREFEDAPASVTHFVKSASYFLPRSDSNLTDFLDMLLIKVQKIQLSESNPERVQKKIGYLIGYSNWSMDAICNIFKQTFKQAFKQTRRDEEVKQRLQTMVGSELMVLGAEDDASRIVDDIMRWKAGEGKGRK